MKLLRRHFLHLAAGAVALPGISCEARAQTYPSRPITMIVPVAAGGMMDVFGRVLAESMARSLGQPVIVENITGAEGTIGVSRAARAKPDGYTVDLGSLSTHVVSGALFSLPYDVLNAFLPISPICTYSFLLLARKTLPANDANELITWLKANSGKASAGIGSAGFRLLTVLFQKETHTQLTFVPYRGEAPASQDLLAGQIDLLFGSPVQRNYSRLCGVVTRV
jgi:tripartite-type tricarboxylate transporter receptor subunit TctC